MLAAKETGDKQLSALKYLISTGADLDAKDNVSYLLDLLYYIFPTLNFIATNIDCNL